jgi:hypothetical protein
VQERPPPPEEEEEDGGDEALEDSEEMQTVRAEVAARIAELRLGQSDLTEIVAGLGMQQGPPPPSVCASAPPPLPPPPPPPPHAPSSSALSLPRAPEDAVARGFTISGAEGSYYDDINRTFMATGELINGKPLYKDTTDGGQCCWYGVDKMWHVYSIEYAAFEGEGYDNACSELGLAAPYHSTRPWVVQVYKDLDEQQLLQFTLIA